MFMDIQNEYILTSPSKKEESVRLLDVVQITKAAKYIKIQTNPRSTLTPLKHRLLRMQHLQQQPYPRITPNLLRQPRSRHTIILAQRRDRLHSESAKQPHQDSHKLDLGEFAAGTVTGAAGPADERTVGFGRLFEFLGVVDGRSGRVGVGSYPS